MSTQIQGFADAPQFLTVDQLVELLQLPSKQTVYFWNRMGIGPSYYRVGRYIRYKRIDVLKWLEPKKTDWMVP